MLIAQITDAHIKARGHLAYRVVDTAAYLKRCIAQIMQSVPLPDVVLFSGDLTDGGLPEEYEHVRELMSGLTVPYFVIPGNHDQRKTMLAAMPERCRRQPGADFIQYAIDDYPVRLIGLDTVIPMSGKGALCAERLDWLENTLDARPDAPTILFLHHPPFATGIHHMDALGLQEGGERLGAIVRRSRQVERIICGHVHRPVTICFHGAVATISPSVAHQTVLDFREDGPSEFIMEPPGYSLHNWLPGIGFVTHFVAIGHYPGPYPYYNTDGSLVR